MNQALTVSTDSVALALGAKALIERLEGKGYRVTRAGSLGATSAEPTVIRGEDVFTGVTDNPDTAIGLGSLSDLQAGQQRMVFGNCGTVHPLDIDAYKKAGGFSALSASPDAILDDVRISGLRGRGGAGFPAHIKWRTVADTTADRKYIVCNADEGDSGTFADRMILEGDPFLLIEGMSLAGKAVGATRGFIYLRSEYPVAASTLCAALKAAREHGYIGKDADFDIDLFVGAGAYICGEETSLLESLEGKRGMIRAKPPLPAVSGLFGKPTLVHNVITLCSVPWIIRNGGDAYAGLGRGASTGTMPFQLSGNIERGGLIEIPFGMPLGEFLENWTGGTRSGRPIRAVQIGGPLGAYLSPAEFDTPLTYEAMAAIGAGIGHGGIVVFDETLDLAEQAEYAFGFCEEESCGKCTPCRVGSVRGKETMRKIIAARNQGHDNSADIELLEELCEVMTKASLCQMGGMTPIPVTSALKRFPGDFSAKR